MSPQDPTAVPSPGSALLVQARLASGRSVADVADALRVREAVVRGIEQDDYTLCGGDVYARGHLRAYARLVGVDEAELLQAYAAWRQESSARPTGGRTRRRRRPAALRGPVPPLHPVLSGRRLERSRLVPSRGMVGSLALSGLVVVLAVPIVSELRSPVRPAHEVAAPTRAASPATPSTRSATPTTRAAAPVTRRTTPRRAATPAPSTTEPDVEGVALALRATENTWVAVRDASGRTVFSGLLGKGDRKRFTDDDRLRVVLGNAGGVQLTVNGRRVGPAGRDGEVKRLTIRPGDPA
jgi:cytoskeleton protein RodZ